MITKVGSNNLCFTATYIESCNRSGYSTKIKNFLDNSTNQQLINKLSKHNIDGLLVQRDDGTVLIQLGQMIQNKFNLFYVTAKLEDFEKNFKKMFKQATAPEYLQKQQELADLRNCARMACQPVVALPRFWFNKG